MKPFRLEQLADGIFAIVMTILVFELRIPDILQISSNQDVLGALREMLPLFLSYILSFAMLFTYWRAHHFFISVYAKNLDTTLTNINAIFFLFVGFVPFTTSLLGKLPELEYPIIIFALNVILLGATLYVMRRYVFHSPHIKNPEVEHAEIVRGTIRTLVPVFFAILAIPLCFYSKGFAMILLTAAIIFNFSKSSTRIFGKLTKI